MTVPGDGGIVMAWEKRKIMAVNACDNACGQVGGHTLARIEGKGVVEDLHNPSWPNA